MSILSAGTSNTTSLVYTGDTTGAMVFQTNGTTEAMRITAAQNVGIGTGSPSQKLHVAAGTGNGIQISSNGETAGAALFLQQTQTSNYTWRMAVGGGDNAWVTGRSLFFRDDNASSVRMAIDTSGRVTMPSQPVFIATVPTAIDLTYNTTHNISQYYTGIDINRGNHYNTSNGRFTAPITGLYSFNWKYYLYPIASTEAYLYVNDNAWIRYQMIYNYSSNTNPGGNQGNAVLYLNAGDYVTLHMNFNTVGGSNATLWNGGPRSSHWSGYLVG
jgi:hypothetical protein